MKDRRLFLVIVMIALGIVLALIARLFMEMQEELIILGFAIFPLIVFGIIYGTITEIGVGGFTAKLGKIANENVTPSKPDAIAPSIEDLITVGQKGIDALEDMLIHYDFSEYNPIVMIIRLGTGDYTRLETLGFIDKLTRYRSFKFVIFVDSSDRFKACMPPWAIRRLLSKPERGDEFISAINDENRFFELSDEKYVVKETLMVDDSNVQALRKMVDKNLESIVVIDKDYHLKGVLERERLLSVMVLALIDK